MTKFKVHGKERREKKKELHKIKSFVKNFWHYHQLDNDMTSFYGGKDTFPMSDEDAQKMFSKKKKEIEKMEELLSVPYGWVSLSVVIIFG